MAYCFQLLRILADSYNKSTTIIERNLDLLLCYGFGIIEASLLLTTIFICWQGLFKKVTVKKFNGFKVKHKVTLFSLSLFFLNSRILFYNPVWALD